jgi:iron complex transport system ATP-binding protein
VGMKLKVKGLSFKYDSIDTLKDIDLELNEHEVVSIVGPNASGKTSLLRCINKVLKPYIGTVYIDGESTARINVREMAKKVSSVPQIAIRSFPFKVLDIVLMGRTPYVKWQLTRIDLEIAEESIKLVGIENLALKYFDELSGGERQKVLIAKAITQEPELLILDEPTTHLDIKHQLEILNLIKALAKSRDIAVLMAIHDLNLAARFSDRIYMIKEGRIFAPGSPMDVLTPENIKEVYDVEVQVVKSEQSIHIIPIRPI